MGDVPKISMRDLKDQGTMRTESVPWMAVPPKVWPSKTASLYLFSQDFVPEAFVTRHALWLTHAPGYVNFGVGNEMNGLVYYERIYTMLLLIPLFRLKRL